MKRCIKGFCNWFTQRIGKMSWEEKVGFLIGVIFGIIISTMVYYVVGEVPLSQLGYDASIFALLHAFAIALIFGIFACAFGAIVFIIISYILKAICNNLKK